MTDIDESLTEGERKGVCDSLRSSIRQEVVAIKENHMSPTFSASIVSKTPDQCTSFVELIETWDFGDGAVVTTYDEAIEHTYLKEGEYTVSVSAQSEFASLTRSLLYQAVDVESQGVIGCGLDTLPAYLEFEYFQLDSKRLRFDASSVSIDDPSHCSFTYHPKTILWDFGDGTVLESSDTVTHNYEAAGEYLVSVSYGSISDTITIVKKIKIQ